MVKMPKLYFYDTGLACSLLGIENEPQLSTHYQKGELFENLVLNELLKFRYNQGKTKSTPNQTNEIELSQDQNKPNKPSKPIKPSQQTNHTKKTKQA